PEGGLVAQAHPQHKTRAPPLSVGCLELIAKGGGAPAVMDDPTVQKERDHDQPLVLLGVSDGLANQPPPAARWPNEKVPARARPALVSGKAAPRQFLADPRAERKHVARRIPVLFVAVPGKGGVDVGAGQWLPPPVAAEGDPAERAGRRTEFADRELDRPPGERVGEIRDDRAR